MVSSQLSGLRTGDGATSSTSAPPPATNRRFTRTAARRSYTAPHWTCIQPLRAQAACMWPAGPRRERHITRASQSGGGLGDEQGLDVAVFRFTLGIPGFEDRFIPRVVGAVGAAMLGLNHIFGAQPPSDAQVRAEYVIFSLAVLCVLVPEIEERLKEALPGRGRQSMAENIAGATNGFMLAPKLPDATKQELAWSSSALIKNTNSCGMVLVVNGKVLLARGALATAAYNPKAVQASLDGMSQDLASLASSPELAAALTSTSGKGALGVEGVLQQHQVYLTDRSAMSGAKAAACKSIPQGAQSLLVQGLPGAAQTSYMLLYSERPRALSDKERRWAAAVATKLAALVA